MPSEKTQVIEILFFKYWDASAASLTKSLMSLEDVSQAIRECNAQHGTTLSDRNPANFMKDFMRGSHASRNWPQTVADLNFTAVQRTGTGDVFEFIPYAPGQTEPFTDAFKITDEAPRYPVQSISLPLVTKMLGRTDES